MGSFAAIADEMAMDDRNWVVSGLSAFRDLLHSSRHRLVAGNSLRSGGMLRGRAMFPIWVYFAVALAIALIAFAIGQMVPGLGVPFMALASTMWTAYSVSRARRLRGR